MDDDTRPKDIEVASAEIKVDCKDEDLGAILENSLEQEYLVHCIAMVSKEQLEAPRVVLAILKTFDNLDDWYIPQFVHAVARQIINSAAMTRDLRVLIAIPFEQWDQVQQDWLDAVNDYVERADRAIGGLFQLRATLIVTEYPADQPPPESLQLRCLTTPAPHSELIPGEDVRRWLQVDEFLGCEACGECGVAEVDDVDPGG